MTANIAPYQLATGTVPGPNGTNDRPVSCAGNVNYFNCRAVSTHCRGDIIPISKGFLLSLFGGPANALINDIYQQINTDISIF